jgi:spoIIIJ-associated protein
MASKTPEIAFFTEDNMARDEKELKKVTEETAEVVEKLLSLMDIPAEVISEDLVDFEIEPGVVPPVMFDLEGDDLGILIGRRGQTLANFQYIVRLIMAHKLQMLVPVTIDVEGYKKRRYESLTVLAQRLAAQVRSRGVPFTLEPMPPDERRVIHLALANDADIVTNSIGEGEDRKVVISLA